MPLSKSQPLPLLSPELTHRIESAHVEFSTQRLQGIADQPGNPYEARITRFGGCVALSANLPIAWMNTIHLVGSPDLEALSQIATTYKEAGRPLRVEVLPHDLTPEIGKALAQLGLIQQGFHAAVYGSPAVRNRTEMGLVETRLVTSEDSEVFLDTIIEAFQTSPQVRGNMRQWIHRPNFRLYLATMGGVPAAVGILSLHEGVGYLAAGATIPRFRGRGCQSALLKRRIADGRELGCEILVGQCEFASPSHRNMQRARLQLAYTKAVWEQ